MLTLYLRVILGLITPVTAGFLCPGTHYLLGPASQSPTQGGRDWWVEVRELSRTQQSTEGPGRMLWSQPGGNPGQEGSPHVSSFLTALSACQPEPAGSHPGGDLEGAVLCGHPILICPSHNSQQLSTSSPSCHLPRDTALRHSGQI
jgi:hypothetical protein